MQSKEARGGARQAVAIVVTGPSGVGKTSVAAIVEREMPDVRRVITVTTRQPRGDERHGVDYRFVGHSTLRTMIHGDEFLDVTSVSGQSYGLERSAVSDVLEAGLVPVMTLDPAGGSRLLMGSHDFDIAGIFLMPPGKSSTKSRLSLRGDMTTDQIRERLSAFEKDMALAPNFDFSVIAASLEETAQRVCEIINQCQRGVKGT